MTLRILKTFTYYDDPPAVPPTVPPVPPPPPAPTTFTQDQVNKMMAEHKKGLQTENQKLVEQLTQIRDTVQLTSQQKEELEARITTLSQQHLTEAQRLQAEAEATKKKLDTTTQTLSAEATKWKNNFSGLVASHAIVTAAAKHKAAYDQQLKAMLIGQVKVVEEVDEKGQPTGNFVAKLPVPIEDPKTKTVTILDLPVDEAVGKMRENPAHANLFLVDGKPGLGATGGVGSSEPGQIDWAKLSPEEYRKKRAQLGIKPRF